MKKLKTYEQLFENWSYHKKNNTEIYKKLLREKQAKKFKI